MSLATACPALSSFLSPLHTTPARISACALARVSARPRSTRSASSRFLPLREMSGAGRALGAGEAEHAEGGLRDVAGIQSRLIVLRLRVIVLDEAVGQDHRAEL